MKKLALIVAALYGLILAVLAAPVALAAFYPKAEVGQVCAGYAAWRFWLWIGVMVLCQAALLVVPVSLANRRPVTQRSLLWPVATAGLMVGGLAAGALYSLYEFTVRDQGKDWIWWAILAGAVAIWIVWSVVFFRMSHGANPADVVTRQCRLLLKGSILELLIAVPTHIVARSRDYCCAGLMTFIGITLGVSVMLFSFGPAVFFLYVDRWRRLHPAPPSEASPARA
jgi:hypothetical protein